MQIKLRDYQIKFKNNILKALEEFNSIVAVMPCGGGKTVVQASIAKDYIDNGKKVIYLVHRKELIEQTENSFANYGIDKANNMYKALSPRMFIKSFAKNMEEDPDLILIDEAHTNLSAYELIFNSFPNAKKIGFTATPTRLKEGGLGKIFENIVESISVNWLIENNFLSPFKYFSKPIIKRSDIDVKRGEFSQSKSGLLVSSEECCYKIVSEWKRLANDLKTMIYCPDIQSSKTIINYFCEKGIVAKHLDGQTSKEERNQIVQDYRNGKIQVLSNAMLFSEGYDDKEIECIMLLRPTLSYALYIQQAMRGMRYKENKTCLILDFVDNWTTHGLPNMERLFDLNEKGKGNGGGGNKKAKTCPKCQQVIEDEQLKCNNCGYEFKMPKKKKGEILKGELKEITAEDGYKNIKLSNFKPKNFEEVVNFCKAKKYKNGWVFHFCKKNNIDINKNDVEKMSKILGFKRGWVKYACEYHNISMED